jgi:uncharacterized membrane protein (DUF441 family)
MLHVTMFLLLAVGVMGMSMVAVRLHRRFPEHRVLFSVLIGVGVAWLANVNLWTMFDVSNLRYAWVGVTVTGLALGGAAEVIHAIYGFFAGLHRKLDDQAEQIELTELRRVA